MRENDKQSDRHLDAPQEANNDKHINFRNSEENARSFADDKNSNDRRKQWQQCIKDGGQQKHETNTPSAMPMDTDDTLGIP